MSGKKHTAQLHLNAAKCGLDGVYSIGPFAQRVSFTVQQQRALNIIWALKHNENINPKTSKRIAVVGAGVSGIMASAALISLGQEVWLFEARSNVLSLQKFTRHRQLHPSINSWPEEQDTPDTTRFPFFDWYSAPCNDVIRLLLDEWDKDFKSHVKFFPETRITSVESSSKNKDKLKLTDENRKEHEADFVLLATGFGEEENLGDPLQKSYWSEDGVEQLRSQKGKHFVVSGTGDGGLIDCLRLVHKQFDDGNLIIAFHREIRNISHIRDRIILAESKAQQYLKNKTKNDDDLSKFYEQEYGEILLSLPDGPRALIDKSILYKNKVTLVGKISAPYQYNSAPIHKLMIMHAIKSQDDSGARAVVYEKASVSRKGKRYFIRKAAHPDFFIDDAHVIIRHGSHPPLKLLLNDEKLFEKIRYDQLMLNSFYKIDEEINNEFYFRDNHPQFKIGDKHFVISRSKLAHSFLRSHFGVSGAIKEDNGKFYFRVRVLDIDSPPENWLMNLPTSIFGITLRPPETGRDSDEPVDFLVRQNG